MLAKTLDSIEVAKFVNSNKFRDTNTVTQSFITNITA